MTEDTSSSSLHYASKDKFEPDNTTFLKTYYDRNTTICSKTGTYGGDSALLILNEKEEPQMVMIVVPTSKSGRPIDPAYAHSYIDAVILRCIPFKGGEKFTEDFEPDKLDSRVRLVLANQFFIDHMRGRKDNPVISLLSKYDPRDVKEGPVKSLLEKVARDSRVNSLLERVDLHRVKDPKRLMTDALVDALFTMDIRDRITVEKVRPAVAPPDIRLTGPEAERWGSLTKDFKEDPPTR